jgi:hypothetical protein
MPAATADAKIEQAIEADERRAARDSYRAAGGSKRRPLKSFMTQAEKKAAREEHAALIRTAVDELRDPVGFERWIETLELNPHLTPMNAALVAMQTPGQIVSTCAQWKRQGYRVRKGEQTAGRITGKGFWPFAYFTAEQASAGDLDGFEVELPDPRLLAVLQAELVAQLDGGTKARDALVGIAERRSEPPPADLPDEEFVQSAPQAEPELFRVEEELPPETRTPEQRLEEIAERRERLARERGECDQELAELATARTVPVSQIAKRIGVSRQAIYQLAAA